MLRSVVFFLEQHISAVLNKIRAVLGVSLDIFGLRFEKSGVRCLKTCVIVA